MSLHPTTPAAVPVVTAAVARAAFPHGSPYLTLRDELGAVFTDAQFAALFARRGQPGEAPGRLALVTLLQYAEDLSDRATAAAVRSRIDWNGSTCSWKCLLGLELTDAGFGASVLSEFRSRLVAGQAEDVLLTTLLAVCRQRKLLTTRGRQRADSTHVLGAVRALTCIACVGATLRAALNALAVAAPEWLRTRSCLVAEHRWDPARYVREVFGSELGQLRAARCAAARAAARASKEAP